MQSRRACFATTMRSDVCYFRWCPQTGNQPEMGRRRERPNPTFRGGNVRADATLCEVLRTYPKYLGQTRPLLILAIAFDAIPRAQARSLVGAAERVEGRSRVAGSVLGPAMVGAERLLADRQRALDERPRRR